MESAASPVSFLGHHRGRVVPSVELQSHLYGDDFSRDANALEVLITRSCNSPAVIVLPIANFSVSATGPESERAIEIPVPSPEDIRAIREKANLSQAVFARRLNVSTGFISQLERGVKRPVPERRKSP